MNGSMGLQDLYGRPLRNLRLSVTDRCNLRCRYCMPEESYVWLERQDLLNFEEHSFLVDCFMQLGVRKIRLTGGEPLLRRDLPTLLKLLAGKSGLEDLALTTNGVLLANQAEDLKQAGLHRLTVSLDTLQQERFVDLTRRHDLARVLEGIRAAQDAGFGNTKLDTVVMRGCNDDELCDLLEFGRAHAIEVRFIEYMDVGGATQWSMDRVVSKAEILQNLQARYGPVQALPKTDSAPADRFQLPDGLTFGVISSTTDPFCSHCDRSRITADGQWLLCLYASLGIDLRAPLRAGVGTEEMVAFIRSHWHVRADRGAEQRVAMKERASLAEVEYLRENPHLEMHTRGG